MTTAPDARVSDKQIFDLALDISAQDTESIAGKFLDIPASKLKSLKEDHQHDLHAFKREILIHWRNINYGRNDCKVSDKNSDIIRRPLVNTSFVLLSLFSAPIKLFVSTVEEPL